VGGGYLKIACTYNMEFSGVVHKSLLSAATFAGYVHGPLEISALIDIECIIY
jgi:hypothetical protein